MIILGHCLVADADLSSGLEIICKSGNVGEATRGWPGCYSMAVFMPGEVLLISDPVGQFPIYIARTAAGVWFGSSVVQIARFSESTVDRSVLALNVACSDVPGAADNSTAFKSVNRLPPGHVMSVRRAGVLTNALDPVTVDRELTFHEAAARLRPALVEAVGARVSAARRISGDLSGGIDSSALIFLSLRTGSPVSGITFHNSEAEVEDDLTWAKHHAGLAPGLSHHLLRATDDDLPYRQLMASPGEPHPSLLAVGPLRARLKLAAEQGSDIYLVGEGGDVVSASPPAYLADLARHGKAADLWRHCVRWGRIRQCSPLTLLRRATALATTTRRHALTSLAETLERGTPADSDPPWHTYAVSYWAIPQADWLTRNARTELAQRVRAMADEPANINMGAGDAVTFSQLRTQVLTQHAVRAVGAEFGLAVHAPFLDTEVVRACLSLPAYRRADPATPKPLLSSALAGLVPDVVLTRPTKGDYTRSAYRGIRQAAPALRDLLKSSAAADYGVVDPAPVRAALDRAVQGLPTPWRALNQVFAVELWLREVSQKVSGG